MASIKQQFIEPSDALSAHIESVHVFLDQGWPIDDARWLGPLCLSTLIGGKTAPTPIDELVESNLGIIARAWKDSGLLGNRDRALLIAYARLFDVGGMRARLNHRPEIPSSARNAMPDLSVAALVASEFRQHREHAKGLDFEAAIGAGWPGEYGSDAEFDSAAAYLGSPPDSASEKSDLIRLMRVLVHGAGLDLSRVAKPDSEAHAGRWRPMPDASEPCARRVIPPEPPEPKSRTPIANSRSLCNWMIAIGPSALARYVPAFERLPNVSYVEATAMDVRGVFEEWRVRIGLRLLRTEGVKQELANAVVQYVELLSTLCAQKEHGSRELLQRARLWYARTLFELDRKRWDNLAEPKRAELLRLATQDLGRMRKLFARAKPKPLSDQDQQILQQDDMRRRIPVRIKRPTPGELGQGGGILLAAEDDGPDWMKHRTAWEEFSWDEDHFSNCVIFLYQFGGVWRGMKPMLLALRSLSAPAVAEDLRYWQEVDRSKPPEPWSKIPESMIALFHRYVGQEQQSDPDLEELRGHLASFCVERLVDRWNKTQRDEATRIGKARANEDMMEPSPIWRYCLIRAFSSLGINPEGLGHRTLHMASEIDPDPEVRGAAREAYKRVQRGMSLPDDVSPRRAIMSALWWMRQAHLLDLKDRFPELEIQLDADGAQRTRIKELSRTKEHERDDNPASHDIS